MAGDGMTTKNVIYDEETYDECYQNINWREGYVNRAFSTGRVMFNEREAGLDHLPTVDRGLTMVTTERVNTGANWHPTLKPIALCEYFAKLAKPPSGRDEKYGPSRLLVPYCGVASEMIGGVLAGFDEVIGIEIVEEFCALGRVRLDHWTNP